MIASRVLVDGRRAAKLAPNDNGHILFQTAPVQVFDQRADALVEQREVGFCVLVIVAVIIPETERDGHDTRAGFNEAARDEKLLHQHRRGVAVGLSRSEEHTSELQSRFDLVCRLLLEKKKKK